MGSATLIGLIAPRSADCIGRIAEHLGLGDGILDREVPDHIRDLAGNRRERICDVAMRRVQAPRFVVQRCKLPAQRLRRLAGQSGEFRPRLVRPRSEAEEDGVQTLQSFPLNLLAQLDAPLVEPIHHGKLLVQARGRIIFNGLYSRVVRLSDGVLELVAIHPGAQVPSTRNQELRGNRVVQHPEPLGPDFRNDLGHGLNAGHLELLVLPPYCKFHRGMLEVGKMHAIRVVILSLSARFQDTESTQ